MWGIGDVGKKVKLIDIFTFLPTSPTMFRPLLCFLESIFVQPDFKEHRDITRVVIALYAQDENLKWHLESNWVNSDGSIKYSEPLVGNSKYNENMTLSVNMNYPIEKKIWDVKLVIIPLGPEEDSIPLEPKSNFGLPE